MPSKILSILFSLCVLFSIFLMYYVFIEKKDYTIFTLPDGPDTSDYLESDIITEET